MLGALGMKATQVSFLYSPCTDPILRAAVD
jgi:hypothetical protein